MKPIKLFEDFVNESQKGEAALQRVDALPNASLSNDSKLIDRVFQVNNRPWTQLVQIWKQYGHQAQTATLNPTNIQITQHEIQLNKVKEMIYRDGKVKTINVIQFPEGPVIYDGHHRLTKAWALGETKLKVNLLKL